MAELNIGVVGAGIGGLAVAALLADDGHRVTLFDQFDTPRALGSGLVIQPVGQAVLARIGAAAAAARYGNPIRRMLGHEAGSGRVVLDVQYHAVGGAGYGLAIHRAGLFHALLEAVTLRRIPIQTCARVIAAPAQGSGRTLLCEDGARHGPFALIADASGTKSLLSPLRGRTLPYGAIWGTVAWPKTSALPLDYLSQRYLRASRMAGVLPLGVLPGNPVPQAAIFWSLRQTDMPTWQATPIQSWKAEATAFWPEFAPFLGSIRHHDDMVTARYSHGTLARPYSEALAFIGDAAHRASPQLGQGANMALLDAMALTIALRDRPVAEALPTYAAMRRWHVRVYQGMSWAFTPQYQSDSRFLPWLRDRVMMPLSKLPPVPRVLTRLVCGDLIPPLASQAFP